MSESVLGQENPESAVRRNIKKSRIVVMLSFLLNAGLNFVLLGFLSRVGGLEFVGQWAFLNAVLSVMLIADFGATNALTHRIGKDGIEKAETLLRSFLALALIPFGITLLVSLIGLYTEREGVLVCGMVLAGGLLRLGANWLIAIRMGQHDQSWFNYKTVVRVTLQTALVVVLLLSSWFSGPVAFAIAILFASTVEFAFSWIAVRKKWQTRGTCANLTELGHLLQGFGVLDVCQRSLQPLVQVIVLGAAGSAALGHFTVCLRAPVIISQSVSEALRALLPGLASLSQSKERHEIENLVAESLAGQILLVFPALTVLTIHAGTIFDVWLGQSSTDLEISTFLLSAAIFMTCVATPFYWALQAFGHTARLSTIMFWITTGTFLTLICAIYLWPVLLTAPAVFALSRAVASLLQLQLSQTRLNLVRSVATRIYWSRIGSYMFASVALNTTLVFLMPGDQAIQNLAVLTAVNAIIFGPLVFRVSKRHSFIRPVKETKNSVPSCTKGLGW